MLLTGYIIFAVAVSIGLGVIVANGKTIIYKEKTKRWMWRGVALLASSIFLSLFLLFYSLIAAAADIISALGR